MSAPAGADPGRIQARLGALLDGDTLFHNSPAMQGLSIALYRLLAHGSPVPRDALGSATGLTGPELDNLLRQIPPSWIEVDEAGSVIAFGGLTLAPTRHRFAVGGRILHTWCAFDALFLPEILDQIAHITSTCPATEATIHLALGPSGLGTVDPPGAVLSIIEPDLDDCRDDLRGAFCCHVNLFADAAAFDRWAGAAAGALTRLSIGDALALAAARNAARYRDIGLGEPARDRP